MNSYRITLLFRLRRRVGRRPRPPPAMPRATQTILLSLSLSLSLYLSLSLSLPVISSFSLSPVPRHFGGNEP